MAREAVDVDPFQLLRNKQWKQVGFILSVFLGSAVLLFCLEKKGGLLAAKLSKINVLNYICI